MFPTLRRQLPTTLLSGALNSMAVGFQVGPLLSDPATLRLPIPAVGDGTWTWMERDGVASWSTGLTLQPSDDQARLPPAPPVLRQGWLQLADETDASS